MLPAGLARSRCTSPGRPWATCRMRGRWRGAAGWTPSCGEAAAGSLAGISAGTCSDWGTPPGQPRTDSVAASDLLNKILKYFKNILIFLKKYPNIQDISKKCWRFTNWCNTIFVMPHLLSSLSSVWCEWRTPLWPWSASPSSSSPSSRTPLRRDTSRYVHAWRHCSQR